MRQHAHGMATSLCARKKKKSSKDCPSAYFFSPLPAAPATSMPAPTAFFPIVLVPLLSQLKRFNFDCIRFVVARFIFSPSLSLLLVLLFDFVSGVVCTTL